MKWVWQLHLFTLQNVSTNFHNDIKGQWIILLTKEESSCVTWPQCRTCACWQTAGATKIKRGKQKMRRFKRTKIRREGEMKMFSFCFACCITISLWAALRALCSIMGNTTTQTSTAKQYPAYISCWHHWTGGNIKIWYSISEGRNCREGVVSIQYRHQRETFIGLNLAKCTGFVYEKYIKALVVFN